MFRSLFDNAKPIQPSGVLKDNKFSIIWQYCYKIERGKAPASSKMRKWSEEIFICRVALVSTKASSQSKETENLSSNDLETVLPSLDHINFPFSKGTSMNFEFSMNLLNFLVLCVVLPSGNCSPPDRIILKSASKHQASVQYPVRESSSGHMNFLLSVICWSIYIGHPTQLIAHCSAFN